MQTDPMQQIVRLLCDLVSQVFPNTIYTLPGNMTALLAILFASVACGSVGSLVVGNRMAFFSDALAHCAFAGFGLGLLIAILSGMAESWLRLWLTPIMVLFGVSVGLGIAFVREKTGQASDTVIGVFFAGAIGLGAILITAASQRRYISAEQFLFGEPATLNSVMMIELFCLTLATAAVLFFLYNDLVFSSFSTALARSRGIRVRFLNYVFIVLLALIVNICLTSVGVLLINALLIVPAATAANLCRNMRQLFPFSIGLCVFSGILGQNIQWELGNRLEFYTGESGVIVVVAVTLYFLSILIGPLIKNRPA